jgi:glutamine synthetase
MDQATWRVVSKLHALKFFVGKNTFSTVEQLKVATVAINQVLTELKVRRGSLNCAPPNTVLCRTSRRKTFCSKKHRDMEWVRVSWTGLSGIQKCKLVRGADTTATIASSDSALPFTQDVPAVTGEAHQFVSLVPDASTLHKNLPHCPGVARVFAVASLESGLPWTLDARTWLLEMQGRLAGEPFGLRVAFQCSFYLLQGSDGGGWHPVDASSSCSVDSVQRSGPLLVEMVEALQVQGVTVASFWAGSGAGQFVFEVAERRECVPAADALAVVKETVRAVAQRAGKKATFVPKLASASAASGIALRLTLEARDGDSNLMALLGEKNSAAHRFFAGVLEHLPSLLAIGQATSNSFHHKGGLTHGWGWELAEAPLRAHGAKHMELTVCDGTANVHLLLGASIAAGIDGVRRELALPEAVTTDTTDAPRLPSDLAASLALLEKNETLSEAMGPELLKCYVAVKKAELEVKTQLPVLLERF